MPLPSAMSLAQGGMTPHVPMPGPMKNLPQPPQAQLNPASASGPGMGGAATMQGLMASVPGDAENPFAQPPPQQAPADPTQVQPTGQAWLPGVQGSMLYPKGQGPVTGQAPKMAYSLLNDSLRSEYGVSVKLPLDSPRYVLSQIQASDGLFKGADAMDIVNLQKKMLDDREARETTGGRTEEILSETVAPAANFMESGGPPRVDKLANLRRSAVGEGNFKINEKPFTLQGEEAWPTEHHYGKKRDSILGPPSKTAANLLHLNGMSETAQDFISTLYKKGCSHEETVELCKEAAAMDPLIAADLAPFLKTAGFGGMIAKGIGAIGKSIGGAGKRVGGFLKNPLGTASKPGQVINTTARQLPQQLRLPGRGMIPHPSIGGGKGMMPFTAAGRSAGGAAAKAGPGMLRRGMGAMGRATGRTLGHGAVGGGIGAATGAVGGTVEDLSQGVTPFSSESAVWPGMMDYGMMGAGAGMAHGGLKSVFPGMGKGLLSGSGKAMAGAGAGLGVMGIGGGIGGDLSRAIRTPIERRIFAEQIAPQITKYMEENNVDPAMFGTTWEEIGNIRSLDDFGKLIVDSGMIEEMKKGPVAIQKFQDLYTNTLRPMLEKLPGVDQEGLAKIDEAIKNGDPAAIDHMQEVLKPIGESMMKGQNQGFLGNLLGMIHGVKGSGFHEWISSMNSMQQGLLLAGAASLVMGLISLFSGSGMGGAMGLGGGLLLGGLGMFGQHLPMGLGKYFGGDSGGGAGAVSISGLDAANTKIWKGLNPADQKTAADYVRKSIEKFPALGENPRHINELFRRHMKGRKVTPPSSTPQPKAKPMEKPTGQAQQLPLVAPKPRSMIQN